MDTSTWPIFCYSARTKGTDSYAIRPHVSKMGVGHHQWPLRCNLAPVVNDCKHLLCCKYLYRSALPALCYVVATDQTIDHRKCRPSKGHPTSWCLWAQTYSAGVSHVTLRSIQSCPGCDGWGTTTTNVPNTVTTSEVNQCFNSLYKSPDQWISNIQQRNNTCRALFLKAAFATACRAVKRSSTYAEGRGLLFACLRTSRSLRTQSIQFQPYFNFFQSYL